jgi:hypothetical protein
MNADGWEARQQRLDIWHDRTANFVFNTLDTDRPPRDDWRKALHDAASEIDKIASDGNHPDDVDRARSAMSALAGMWLEVEEMERQLCDQ